MIFEALTAALSNEGDYSPEMKALLSSDASVYFYNSASLEGVYVESVSTEHNVVSNGPVFEAFSTKLLLYLSVISSSLCYSIPKLRYTVKYHPQQSIRCQAGDFISSFNH